MLAFINNNRLKLLFKWYILILLLLISISSIAIMGILNKESNPFFYANF